MKSVSSGVPRLTINTPIFFWEFLYDYLVSLKLSKISRVILTLSIGVDGSIPCDKLNIWSLIENCNIIFFTSSLSFPLPRPVLRGLNFLVILFFFFRNNT